MGMDNNQSEIESDKHPDSPSPDQPEKVSNIIWPFLIPIVFAIVILVISGYIIFPMSYKERVETNTRNQLREIGASQYAYQGTNNKKFYGSFNALQNMRFIDSVSNPETYIDGYDLNWHLGNISLPEDVPLARVEYFDSFTIVAYPRIIKPPELRTFGISEDQILRVYNP
ncbi:MAG: hypothetical protein NTY09_07195, partial [bacterium]|nr:hypothetical protein [bacterium]